MSDNTKHVTEGYDVSAEATDTIENTEVATSTLDLGRSFFLVRVSIDDCTNIPASTTMSFTASPIAEPTSGDVLHEVWELNGAAQVVTGALPGATNRPVAFALRDAVGIRRIVCTLSQAATGDVDIRVQGMDGGKAIV